MVGLILREQIADEAAMSRRAFLQGTGLLLGFALTGASTESVFAAPASRVVENEVTGTFSPNGFIRINPTGAVTLVMPMAEMGQGVYTALSMLLAEELEVKLDQVQVQHAPNSPPAGRPSLPARRSRPPFSPCHRALAK